GADDGDDVLAQREADALDVRPDDATVGTGVDDADAVVAQSDLTRLSAPDSRFASASSAAVPPAAPAPGPPAAVPPTAGPSATAATVLPRRRRTSGNARWMRTATEAARRFLMMSPGQSGRAAVAGTGSGGAERKGG